MKQRLHESWHDENSVRRVLGICVRLAQPFRVKRRVHESRLPKSELHHMRNFVQTTCVDTLTGINSWHPRPPSGSRYSYENISCNHWNHRTTHVCMQNSESLPLCCGATCENRHPLGEPNARPCGRNSLGVQRYWQDAHFINLVSTSEIRRAQSYNNTEAQGGS